MTTAQNNLRQAILSGDTDAMQAAVSALTQEPIAEKVAQIAALRTQIAELAEELQQLRPEVAARAAACRAKGAEIAAAQKEHGRLLSTSSNLQAMYSMKRSQINQGQIEIDRLEAELEYLANVAGAPVVHDMTRYQRRG